MRATHLSIGSNLKNDIMPEGSFAGRVVNPDLICRICDKEIGQTRIKTGLVCDKCMPSELLSSSSSLKEYNIRSYYANNPKWKSVCDLLEEEPFEKYYDHYGSIAFTGRGKTTLADELNRAIEDAEKVDIVVSFIRSSGLDLLLGSLRRFTDNRRLRVITTTYMGATEADAVLRLSRLRNTEVKIEYVSGETRLHAKAFIFHRSDGRNTAYIGSANLSRAALTDGEEWVVKLTEKDVPVVIADLVDGFERLWNSEKFLSFSKNDIEKLNNRLNNGS